MTREHLCRFSPYTGSFFSVTLIFSVTTNYGCIGYYFAKIYASVSHEIKTRIITKPSLLSAKVISKKENVVNVDLISFASKSSQNGITVAI